MNSHKIKSNVPADVMEKRDDVESREYPQEKKVPISLFPN